MTVKVIDPNGTIWRTVHNVRAIEQPTGSTHPASWWLLMETTDTPVVVAKKHRLFVESV